MDGIHIGRGVTPDKVNTKQNPDGVETTDFCVFLLAERNVMEPKWKEKYEVTFIFGYMEINDWVCRRGE